MLSIPDHIRRIALMAEEQKKASSVERIAKEFARMIEERAKKEDLNPRIIAQSVLMRIK